MQPIYNIIDNWTFLTIEFKEDSITKEIKPWWKTFFINKKYIKRNTIRNQYGDLDNIY